MKIIPIVKEHVYLADDNPDFARMEGECPESERVWVSVRQATEQDHIDVAELRKRRAVRWIGDSPEEVTAVNTRVVWAMQAYLTLTGAGNITFGDGTPVFKFASAGKGYNKFDGDFNAFKNAWGQLPPVVIAAILSVVWKNNPEWTWWTVPEEPGEPDLGEGLDETVSVSEIT